MSSAAVYSPLPKNDDAAINSSQDENTDDENEFLQSSVSMEMHLSLGSASDSSNMASLMNVIKGNLGTGILAMPTAIRNMGLLLGTVSILFIGVIATHCMHVLLRSAKRIRERDGMEYLDYAELMHKCCLTRFPERPKLAQHLRNFVNVSLLITQIGFCCCYILFVAENLQAMFHCFFSSFNLDIHLYKFFVLVALIPYVFVRNLNVLSYFSTFANITTATGLVIIFAYCIQNIPNYHQYPIVKPVSLWPVSFGIIIFAFEGISLVLPIESSMKTPKDFYGISGVLQLGMTIVICLYTSVGFYGYLKFGEKVEPAITLNIPCDDDVLHILVKPLFCFALFISYGLQFYVPAEILTGMMRARVPDPRRQRVLDAAIRIGMAIFTFAAAATIPHLDLMIALIGAFSSSCLALIFPALIQSLLYTGKGLHFKNILIGTFGLIGFFVGTFTTLFEIIKAFQKDYQSV